MRSFTLRGAAGSAVSGGTRNAAGADGRRILLVVAAEPDGSAFAGLPDLSGKEVRVVAPTPPRPVGADDVLLAVEDELRVFAADEIWLVTEPSSEATWLENGLHGSGLGRFGIPVRRALTRPRRR